VIIFLTCAIRSTPKIDQHTDGKPDRILEEVLEAGIAVVAKNLGLDAEEIPCFGARMVIRWEWDDQGPTVHAAAG
jgi:hypothetical protein